MLGRIVLSISALLFMAYGLVSFFFPAVPAGSAGLVMSNGDAFAEIGAMYGGLQTGIGLFCLLAVTRPELYRAGLIFLIIGIGALALARLYSTLFAMDSVGVYTYGALGYEIGTVILALIAFRKSNEKTLDLS